MGCKSAIRIVKLKNLFLIFKQGLNKLTISKFRIYFRKLEIQKINLSIISSNCAAGVIYHDWGKKFLTPTINLYFKNEDFILFCEKLPDILNENLREVNNVSKYPIGLISNSVVHFLHYKSFAEAKNLWDKRKKRVDKDYIIILFIEREKLTNDQYNRLISIKFPKLIVSPYRSDDNFIINVPKKDIDCLFHFVGLTGKRRYEKYFDLKILQEIFNKQHN